MREIWITNYSNFNNKEKGMTNKIKKENTKKICMLICSSEEEKAQRSYMMGLPMTQLLANFHNYHKFHQVQTSKIS